MTPEELFYLSLRYVLETQMNTGMTTVLEFGTAGGGSISMIRSKLSDKYKLYGFDTFEGLPEDWTNTTTNKVLIPKGSFSVSGNIPNIPDVKFYKGLFTDTIPVYMKDNRKPIALIHMDCDLYSSTKEVLTSLNSYIVSGTIIVFDEYTYRDNHGINYDHEALAFTEWLKEYNREYEIIPFEDEADPMRLIVRITK